MLQERHFVSLSLRYGSKGGIRGLSNSFPLVVQALPLLSSAILLLLIFVFLFGVAGIQLFQNAAHQTCVNIVDSSYPDPALTQNSDEWGCGHRHCPSNYTCTVGPCQQVCYFALRFVVSAEAVFPVWHVFYQSIVSGIPPDTHLVTCRLLALIVTTRRALQMRQMLSTYPLLCMAVT